MVSATILTRGSSGADGIHLRLNFVHGANIIALSTHQER